MQANFDLFVKGLVETDDWDWGEPNPKKRKYEILDGQHAGLCELKFRVNGRKFRPLGILLPERREFVFLGGCEKQRMNTIPPGAFDAAFRLKGLFEERRGGIREHV